MLLKFQNIRARLSARIIIIHQENEETRSEVFDVEIVLIAFQLLFFLLFHFLLPVESEFALLTIY